MEEMPTEWEQDVAEIYVNMRQIVRPNTNIKTALISVLLFMLVTVIIAWLAYYVFRTVGIFSYLPSNVRHFLNEHSFLSIIMHFGIVVVIEAFFCFKYAVIGVIKLYQHYAPDEIRRRCLFMPTCSEYAIIAIRKYGGFIGLCKSYYLLVYLCRGNVYRIHYP